MGDGPKSSSSKGDHFPSRYPFGFSGSQPWSAMEFESQPHPVDAHEFDDFRVEAFKIRLMDDADVDRNFMLSLYQLPNLR